MKILHVIPYFTPKRGGDVNVCYNISKVLSGKGHEITIITTDFEFDEKYAKSLEDFGINIVIFKCYFNLSLFLYSPSMRKWLKNNLKNFDLIHLHDLRSYQNNLVHKYSLKYNIPYILQPHGSTSRKSGKTFLKWIYDVFYGYNIIKDANKVLAVSKEEREYDYEMGATFENISVVYNGMDLEQFEKLPKYGSFKEKFGISEKIILLYVGRINPTKGLDFAIRSFKEITKELDDLVFIIAGYDDCNYETELKKLVHDLDLDNVKFLGFLSEEEKIMAYTDADIFIHTVKYMGGVGLAPLESILCGTPTIVTDGCGELIKSLNCGYLVEYENVNNLKEKVSYVVKNEDDRLKKVEIGKQFILNNLSWKSVAKRVENLYENCFYNL